MSGTTAPSRAVLSKWMTDVAGVHVGTAPEKQCANGALYCTLLDHIRPVREEERAAAAINASLLLPCW